MSLRLDRRAVSYIDVLIVLAVIAAAIALFAPVWRKARCGVASLVDKTQIQQIHKACLGFAAENDGQCPIPGLIQRQSRSTGEAVHDFSQNHSAPLYSFLVATNRVKPEILVSPECMDETDAVWVKRDYNYSAYDPAANRYWDTSFTMRIDDEDIGANSSYAHLALCGDRLIQRWRNTSNAGSAMLGTRGTRGGVNQGDEFTRSPTLRLHMTNRNWVGHVAFADNHTETLDSFYSPLATFKDANCVATKDNLYAADLPHPLGNEAAGDSFLGVFIGATEFAVEDIYDPLE